MATDPDYMRPTQRMSSTAREFSPDNMAIQRRLRTAITTKNTVAFLDVNPEDDTADKLNEDNEVVEISSQLVMLKKRNDQSRNASRRREANLDQLNHDQEQLELLEKNSNDFNNRLQKRLEELTDKIGQVKSKHEESKFDRKVYLKVLERMKQTKIHLDVKTHEMSRSLKNKEHVQKLEEAQMLKKKERKINSRYALNNLRETMTAEQTRNQKHLVQLQKNLFNRQDAATRRDERQRKNAEVAENAANEDRDQNEVKLKEDVALNRFWYRVMKKKLQRDMEKSVRIENSFNKIRSATGLYDVQEIEQRFLTKEQTYADIVDSIGQEEKKLEMLKEENKHLEHELRRHRIMEDGITNVDQDILKETKQEKAAQLKHQAFIDEKLHKCLVSYDKVVEWSVKNLENLGTATGDEIKITDPVHSAHMTPAKNALQEYFGQIKGQVFQLMSEIRSEKQELSVKVEKDKGKLRDDIFDSVNDDFLRKLVRVKPNASRENLDILSAHSPDLDEEYQNHMTDLREQRANLKNESQRLEEAAKRKKPKDEKKPRS